MKKTALLILLLASPIHAAVMTLAKCTVDFDEGDHVRREVIRSGTACAVDRVPVGGDGNDDIYATVNAGYSVGPGASLFAEANTWAYAFSDLYPEPDPWSRWETYSLAEIDFVASTDQFGKD